MTSITTSTIGQSSLLHMVRRGDLPSDIRIETLPCTDATSRPEIAWRTGEPRLEWFRALLDGSPGLRWIHSDYTGVEDLPLDELAARGILLTTAVGANSRPIAEWIALALLTASKGLLDFVDRSARAVWDTSIIPVDLVGRRALMLGLGSIGVETARLLDPFGLRLTAVTRRPRPDPVPGVERVISDASWLDLLAESDFLICTLPLTKRTDGMIGKRELALLPSHSWLISISRGAVVDSAALISRLDAGLLGGAVLDGHRPEPLPVDHPLWRRPNVLILPHHTWRSPHSRTRFEAMFVRQFHRWVNIEEMVNVVDYDHGY
ncbi:MULTISPECIES: D-2-hydroxyacid dehydrogenase [unclassified Frankia]|uniref:D-2-hydroxyacid dehydrogenase n=1 Tax=unclassified Frankia TaxID=2632575 RepID=UPI002AD34F4E|nr:MULTISPECIES: D-2-hydroxyacid dehydrogenase [unclassified Frankia]